MKVDIIPIGNSKGIRIPKPMLEQCGFDDSVDIEVNDKRIVLSPVPRVREGWEKAFKAMAARNDDQLLDTPAPAWDEDEWQW